MTSLTPDELIMMMSNRQHDSAGEEDEEQRTKRWKQKQEEGCQAFRRSGGASDDWTAEVSKVKQRQGRRISTGW